MEKKLFFTLLLLSLVVSIFAQISHMVYIELVTEDGQHPEFATFSAWLDDDISHMITEISPECMYLNSGVYQGTVVIQCASLYTDWHQGDILHVNASTSLGNGERNFVLTPTDYQFFGEMFGNWTVGIILNEDLDIPNANFLADHCSGESPLTVNFTSQSSSDVTEWYWDFDSDGIIDSNEQNPTWVYEYGTYRVYLCVFNSSGYGDAEIKVDYITVDSASADDNELQVNDFNLENHPNPFNPETTISYELPKDVRTAKIEIYNIKGQKIKKFELKSKKLGMNTVVWNGKDDNGKTVSSGVYFYRLNVSGKTEAVKKCVLMK